LRSHVDDVIENYEKAEAANVVPALIQALGDETGNVKLAAAEALREIIG
jgi:hypothetical protein